MQHGEAPSAVFAAPSREAVFALAASLGSVGDRTVYAATMAGLYCSRAAGEHWERREILAEEVPLFSVTLSPALDGGGVLLAGAIEGGILRSTDGGAHWSLANFGGRQPQCDALVISPEFCADGKVFAGSMGDGVFYSQNRGANWEARNFGLLDLNVLALAVSADFARDETLYVATPSGLFRSSNGARAWREVASPSADAPVQCLAYAAAADGSGILVAGTDGAGVFRSDDRGATWLPAGEMPEGTCVNALAIASDTAGDQHVFALTDSMLYLSRDAGTHWERCADVAGALCLSVAPDFATGGPIMIGLAEHGIARSTDLTRWHTVSVVENTACS